jgi:GT2 family glycosyltransferase
VHVVDSGSTDGSPDRVREAHPDVRVTRLDSNRGPCATRNRGISEAATPLVLCIDDDTRLDSGGLARLRDAIVADEARALAGPCVCFGDRPDIVQYEGGVCHYAGLPHIRRHEEPAVAGPPVEVDVVTSGCLLARRDAVLAAGGFDESYFYLMEDVDLSLRLRIRGHRLVVVPEARCWNAGASEGLSLRTTAYPSRRVYLHARNRWLMLFGAWEWWSLVVAWAPLLLFECAWFAFAALSGHPFAYVRGKLAALVRLPAVIASRARLRGVRVVRDHELLKAPPLTFTRAALAQPAAGRMARLLDHLMRLYHTMIRGVSP